jgi:hypothetical protein
MTSTLRLANRSAAELLLAAQLEQAGIPFEREVRFAPPRRWRADFCAVLPKDYAPPHWKPPILIEVEGGSFTGGHKRGKAYESDCDKQNAAMDLGFRVYRFTPAMVEDGRALAVIRQALGIEAAA